MRNKAFIELAEKAGCISKGEKVTFFMLNEFGFPCVFHAKMERSQYTENTFGDPFLKFFFIPKGKRKARGITLKRISSFAVWKGWLDVKGDMYVGEKEEGKLRMSLPCFSPEYLQIALGSVAEQPIVANL